MKKFEDYLDDVRAKFGWKTNREVAAWLGIAEQKLTDIRKGRQHLQLEQALMIADALGENATKIQLAERIDNAKSEQEATHWRKWFQRVEQLAACLLIAIGTCFVSPTPANASTGAEQVRANLYYVN